MKSMHKSIRSAFRSDDGALHPFQKLEHQSSRNISPDLI